MTMEKKNYYIIIIISLCLILILNILSLFKKDSALKLEELKVGGPENMKLVEQLYSSETYISQQTAAIEQALAQIQTVNNVSEEDMNNLLSGETSEIMVEDQKDTNLEEIAN